MGATDGALLPLPLPFLPRLREGAFSVRATEQTVCHRLVRRKQTVLLEIS